MTRLHITDPSLPIPREPVDGWRLSPRVYALRAAQLLADALDMLNRSGIPALDHQRDGYAYGEANDALRITMAALYGGELAERIRDLMLDSDRTLTDAAVIIADHDVIDATESLELAVDAVAAVENSLTLTDDAWENAWHRANEQRSTRRVELAAAHRRAGRAVGDREDVTGVRWFGGPA